MLVVIYKVVLWIYWKMLLIPYQSFFSVVVQKRKQCSY